MMDTVWLLLAVAVEFVGGHSLKQSGSPVWAFLCWLKALIILSVWIALSGDHSSIRTAIGAVVFIVGVICIAMYFDRHYPNSLRASGSRRDSKS